MNEKNKKILDILDLFFDKDRPELDDPDIAYPEIYKILGGTEYDVVDTVIVWISALYEMIGSITGTTSERAMQGHRRSLNIFLNNDKDDLHLLLDQLAEASNTPKTEDHNTGGYL